MEIRKLNTLRGLAALIVFATHFSDVTGWLDGSLGGRAGQYGVMLFFLLSGFLMGHLYLRQKFSASRMKTYIVARAGRVLPLYLLVVALSFLPAQWGLSGLYDITDKHALISHLLFIYGESVLWSIAPEIHFYLLFAAIWMLTSWRPGYLPVLVAGALVVLFLLNFPRPHGEVANLPYDFHVFRNLPYFLTGMLMGYAYRVIDIPEYLRSHGWVLMLLLIPLLYPDFSPVSSDAKMRMWLNYEVLLVMATVFFTVVFLVPESNLLLSNKVGDFLGKISYSLYLLHMPLLHYLHSWQLPVHQTLALAVTAALFLAWLSFHLIEQPAARLIRNGLGKSDQTARTLPAV